MNNNIYMKKTCEWEFILDAPDRCETQCGHDWSMCHIDEHAPSVMSGSMIFCPFCGKKIVGSD